MHRLAKINRTYQSKNINSTHRVIKINRTYRFRRASRTFRFTKVKRTYMFTRIGRGQKFTNISKAYTDNKGENLSSTIENDTALVQFLGAFKFWRRRIIWGDSILPIKNFDSFS